MENPPNPRMTPSRIAMISYMVVVACTLIVLAVTATYPFLSAVGISDSSTGATIMGVIVASLALTIASAILIPEIRINGIVKQHEEELRRDFQRELAAKEEVSAKEITALKEEVKKIHAAILAEIRGLNSTTLETLREANGTALAESNRLDAHMSRVTGIEVGGADPVWGLGWLLRSTRRYASLPQEDRRRYSDLLEMIEYFAQEYVQSIKKDANLGAGNVGLEAARTSITNIAMRDSKFFSGHSGESERQKRRKIVRLIKDFFDLSLYYKHVLEQENAISPELVEMQVIRRIIQVSTPISFLLAIFALTDMHADELLNQLGTISYTKKWEMDPSATYSQVVRPAIERANQHSQSVLSHFLGHTRLSNFGVDYLSLPPTET
jgi:hypothetical protein